MRTRFPIFTPPAFADSVCFFVSLQSASQSLASVPSSRLYQAYALQGFPIPSFNFPTLPSASQSIATGAALTTSRTCTPARFTITARDTLANQLGSDQATVFARVTSWVDNTPFDGTFSDRATASYVPPGTYTVTYSALGTTNLLLHSSFIDGPGIVATYYDGGLASGAATVTTRLQEAIDFSTTLGNKPTGVNSLADNGDFSVRWTGFLRPDNVTNYTIYFGLGGRDATNYLNQPIRETGERVKLWLDTHLLIDQWTSLSSTRPSATVGFAELRYFDLTIEYLQSGDDLQHTLSWSPCLADSDPTAPCPIPSSSLFRGESVKDSPWSITPAPPLVRFASPGNGPASGGTAITVLGDAFGIVPACGIRAYVGGTAAATTWLSSVTVRALSPPGTADAHDVTVVMGTLQSLAATYAKFTYDSPSLTAVWVANAPDVGGTSVTVFGTNFGTYDTTPAARLGGTACEATSWLSDSEVGCKVAAGSGDGLNALVTVANRIDVKATISNVFTYDAPRSREDPNAIVLADTNAPPIGGSSVTLYGFNFRTSDRTLRVRLGETACEASEWQSDSSVICKTPTGIGAHHSVVLTLDDLSVGGKNTRALAFSFDAPTLTGTSRWNLPTTGSISVTVTGSNFGTNSWSAHTRIGRTATPALQWTSDSEVVCLAPIGLGTLLPITITVSEQSGSLTGAVTYDFNSPIGLFTLPSMGNLPAQGTCPGLGASCTSVTVSGRAFGEFGFSQTVRLGGTACETTVWKSESSLVCRGAGGVRGMLNLIVTVDSRYQTLTEAFTYDKNIINPSTGSNFNMPTTGSRSVTVTGLNFGEADYTARTRMGFTAAEASNWLSDTSIAVRPASGLRATRSVMITLVYLHDTEGRIGSATETFSYDAPSLSVVKQVNLPATGSSVTVFGTSFAQHGYTQAGRVGDTACEATDWVADTSVMCKVSAGVRGTRRVLMTVGERVGTVTEAFSFDVSSISSVAFINMAATGQSTTTLSGANFGTQQYTQAARAGDTACEATDWVADTSVKCKVSAGVRGTRRVLMTVGERVGTVTDAFSFDISSISSVALNNLAATGGSTTTLSGANFGTQQYTQAARAGDTACEATDWGG